MDALGNILILGIGLASVGFGKTTSPAKLGVVLTYALSIVRTFYGFSREALWLTRVRQTQFLSQMVQQMAQVEQE